MKKKINYDYIIDHSSLLRFVLNVNFEVGQLLMAWCVAVGHIFSTTH